MMMSSSASSSSSAPEISEPTRVEVEAILDATWTLSEKIDKLRKLHSKLNAEFGKLELDDDSESECQVAKKRVECDHVRDLIKGLRETLVSSGDSSQTNKALSLSLESLESGESSWGMAVNNLIIITGVFKLDRKSVV